MASNGRFRIIVTILVIAIIIAATAAFTVYRWVQHDNIKADQPTELFVYSGTDFEKLLANLQAAEILEDPSSFRRVAGWMKFGDAQVKSGRYLIESNWSNRTLINVLRTGRQSPVRVTINNARTVEDVVGKLTQHLELDSQRLLTHLFNPKTMEELGLKQEELITLFIPNTYEMFWNIGAVSLVNRMRSEMEKFWQDDNRLAKADALGMTPIEVYTLASIVEKETQASSERPVVAGLYINRLKHGIPLQADPTVVFGVGDFEIRRVLHKHLAIDSPYNTYLHSGLPPGPIYMAAISSIDAVLNHEKHNYLYMCARPDNSGLHAFAETRAAHSRNAARYHRWLDKMGIR